jgi:signal transduction histidine kinase
MDLRDIGDKQLLDEISLRFEEKNASLKETEFLNKKLIDLNNQLLLQDSVKSQFLSLIKNEFNNPISSLLNLSGRLAANPDTDKRASISHMMHLEVLRLDFQIKNIIAANEIEAGETQNYIVKVDMQALLEDIQRPFKYIIEDKNLSIAVKDESNSEAIYTDIHKLELILSNLLSNACEFSFLDKEITIEEKKYQCLYSRGYFIE